MKLITKSIDDLLFKQFPLGSDLENQKVVAKIFNPYGRGTWFLLNSDPEDPDYIWAIVDFYDLEIGSVSRSDLEDTRIKIGPYQFPLERDMSFNPVNAEELFSGLLSGKQYKCGGMTYKQGGSVASGEWLIVDGDTNQVIEKKSSYIAAKKQYNKLWNSGKYSSLGLESASERKRYDPTEYAKGGNLDSAKELIGQLIDVYHVGVKNPRSYKIKDVKVTPENYSHRDVAIYIESNVDMEPIRIPIEDFDKFLRVGVDVKSKDSNPDPIFVVLTDNRKKPGEKFKFAKGGEIKTMQDLKINPNYPEKFILRLKRDIEDLDPEKNKAKAILLLSHGKSIDVLGMSDNQYDNILKSIIRMDKTQDHDWAFRTLNYSTMQLGIWAKEAIENMFVTQY